MKQQVLTIQFWDRVAGALIWALLVGTALAIIGFVGCTAFMLM